MYKKTIRIIALCTLSLLLGVTIVPRLTSAQTSVGTISGWAWSGTIGWLSANSSDAGAGGGPYSLSVDSSGNITGDMWSPNIGWVQFGGLSGFPSSGSNAAVNLSSGAVTGWARACAGTANGDCSSMTSRSDGWDGWIELSGTNHATGDSTGSSGVTYVPSTKQFVGYAWGGPVVGWIQFNSPTPVVFNPTAAPTVACSPSTTTHLSSAGTVTFTASASGGSGVYDYSWDGGVTWVSGNTDTITYSAPGGSGPSLYVRDHTTTSLQSAASPSCGAVTVTAPASGALLIGPTAATATKTSLPVGRGQSFDIKWNNTLPSGYTCSPSVTPPAGQSAPSNWTAWTGQSNFSGTGDTGLMPTNSSTPLGKYIFTLYCSDGIPGDATISNSVNMNVTASSEGEI